MKNEVIKNNFVLRGSDPRNLLSHMAFYGLASIIEAGKDAALELSWTGTMDKRPQLWVTENEVGETVHSHAKAHDNKDSWIAKRFKIANREQGLMSPRISKLPDSDAWKKLQDERHEVLDSLTKEHAWLDLRLLWSLGEPSYRRGNGKREWTQDDWSSRLEMQPRNRGSEIISQRFIPLAENVSGRSVEEIIGGLRGDVADDKLGSNRSDSRSATGFRGPGPVDDTMAWCAIWGISQFALTISPYGKATTAGHLRNNSGEWFYVPVWKGTWFVSRLRTVLASGHLRAFATEAVGGHSSGAIASTSAEWLRNRGVSCVITFPVKRFGSANAPEPRAQLGTLHRLG